MRRTKGGGGGEREKVANRRMHVCEPESVFTYIYIYIHVCLGKIMSTKMSGRERYDVMASNFR